MEPLLCDASRMSCRGPTTHLHCPVKAYEALGSPLQLYGDEFIARHSFTIGLVLAIWPHGVLWSHYYVMNVE